MEGSPRTLAGRYRLEEVVGRGGMSTVYRATDLVLGRTVAVKVLLDVLATEDATYVARFEREARAAAALANPAVVTIYDSGVDESTRFIVMEYVEGKSVATMLRERGALGVEEAVEIARAVAGALASAHAARILHRDIKPANVMVSPSGEVKVLDFGIARPLSDATLTRGQALVGTVAYMSPERVSGASGDERSDIYSLGCLLYAMLTGSPPFTGELTAAVLHQHLSATPARLRDSAAGVPPALDALVAQMLEKDPRQRPQSAAEVRDRLAALSGLPTAATVPVSGLGGAAAAGAPAAGAAAAEWAPAAGAAAAGAPAAGAAAAEAVTRRAAAPRAPAELAAVNRVMPHPRMPSGVPVLATLLAAVILIAGISVLLATGGSGKTSGTTHSSSAKRSTTSSSSTSRTTTSSSTPTSTVTLTKTATAPTTSAAPPKHSAGPGSGPATPPAVPPGHGGTPPGQAKKHGH